jgi:hypothetical protein
MTGAGLVPAPGSKEAEVAMYDAKHPAKHLVREYLARGWATLIPAALKIAPARN